jgi:hypothetical protein
MSTVKAAIRTALNNDATLVGLIGASRVWLGWKTERRVCPCVTIISGSEGSTARPGYNSSGHRDMSPSVQIDVWITRGEDFPCTDEDCELIAQAIDTLLFKTGVANTHGWARVSTSGPVPDDNMLHMGLRYVFAYSVTD